MDYYYSRTTMPGNYWALEDEPVLIRPRIWSDLDHPASPYSSLPSYYCESCCRPISDDSSFTSIKPRPMDDDITYRALPDMSLRGQVGLDAVLTSRRYPYNRTMSELYDDLASAHRINSLFKKTSYLPDPIPRVVGTSYVDDEFKCSPTTTSGLRRWGSLENLASERSRSFYEKPVSWYRQSLNDADLNWKGSSLSHLYTPAYSCSMDRPITRSYRSISRYVREPKPFHSARELEMDRIQKQRYLEKFFSKKNKPTVRINDLPYLRPTEQPKVDNVKPTALDPEATSKKQLFDHHQPAEVVRPSEPEPEPVDEAGLETEWAETEEPQEDMPCEDHDPHQVATEPEQKRDSAAERCDEPIVDNQERSQGRPVEAELGSGANTEPNNNYDIGCIDAIREEEIAVEDGEASRIVPNQQPESEVTSIRPQEQEEEEEVMSKEQPVDAAPSTPEPVFEQICDQVKASPQQISAPETAEANIAEVEAVQIDGAAYPVVLDDYSQTTVPPEEVKLDCSGEMKVAEREDDAQSASVEPPELASAGDNVPEDKAVESLQCVAEEADGVRVEEATTGQILVVETDLDNNECIQTEFPVEEVEISEME